MEKKRLVTIATTAAIALTLAGCGTQQAANSTGSSSETSLLAKKSATKISANNLSPQKTVSLVTVYAGNKFGGAWAKTAKAAKKNGLVTDLESTNGYKLSGKNQGVAYHVHANNQQSKLVYTVNGNKVSIYQNAQKSSSKKLATVSRHQMVNFINDNGQGQLVNQLASQAQINDQRGSSSSANSTHASVGKYGNQGTVNVPTAMQGTWYSAEYGDSSITFGAHTLAVHGDGEGSQLTLYRQDPHADFDMDDHSIQNATKDWGRTTFNNVNGLNFLTVQGWCQSAGDGSSYAIHTETINGQKVQVLVEAGGAGFWTEGVYYRSQSMAKQQAKVHYDDLHY